MNCQTPTSKLFSSPDLLPRQDLEMQSGPDQVHQALDQFGLDDRSVEELKEKAITAKARAYCMSMSISISISICPDL